VEGLISHVRQLDITAASGPASCQAASPAVLGRRAEWLMAGQRPLVCVGVCPSEAMIKAFPCYNICRI